MENINFPRFIPPLPQGEDLYGGQSQQRLARGIAKYITQNDSDFTPKDDKRNAESNTQNTDGEEQFFPRIIGLEGAWGSGKSNVVLLLEKELGEQYRFFTYDAWANQEDLQRRSILELLKEYLKKKLEEEEKKGKEEKVNLDKLLQNTLARKRKTHIERSTQLGMGILWVVLITILSPIALSLSEFFPSLIKRGLISISPLLLGLIVWCTAYLIDQKKYTLSYILSLYRNKEQSETVFATINEAEPTVKEFTSYLKKISDLFKNNPKLVMVFDNMDRLPAGKVRKFWSSILTFFAGKGFANIWAIIPYDAKHLASTFGKGTPAKNLADGFINKTCPVVYRVAPPVITDFHDIFDKLFGKDFGNTVDSSVRSSIRNLYRTLRNDTTVREIISFINELVALKLEWCEDISLLSMALFCLKKDEILEDPITIVFSNNLIKDCDHILSNNLSFIQKEIPALVYGINIKFASQILLKRYIESCISNRNDINRVRNHEQFDIVLNDYIYNEQYDTNSAIICLSKLDRHNSYIINIWNNLFEQKLKLRDITFDNTCKSLLLHISVENQNQLLNIIYRELRKNHDPKSYADIGDFFEFLNLNLDIECDDLNLNDDIFINNDYCIALNQIQSFIDYNNLQCTIPIEELETEPFILCDYIIGERYNYKKYKLTVNNKELLEYLFNNGIGGHLSLLSVIETLKSDSTYSLDALGERVKEALYSNSEPLGKSKEFLLGAYRILFGQEFENRRA